LVDLIGGINFENIKKTKADEKSQQRSGTAIGIKRKPSEKEAEKFIDYNPARI
jgi:hypothetical protein